MAAESTPEFLIKLIVRAQNQAAGVLGQVQGQLDKVTGAANRNTEATKKNTKATKDHGQAMVELDERYQRVKKDIDENRISSDEAADALKRLSAEYKKLGASMDAGTDGQRAMDSMARATRELGQLKEKEFQAEKKRSISAQEQELQRIEARKTAEQDALNVINAAIEDAARAKRVAVVREEREAATRLEQDRKNIAARHAEEMDASHEERDAIERMGAAERRLHEEQESQARAAARRKRREHAEDMAEITSLLESLGEVTQARARRPQTRRDETAGSARARLAERVAPADRARADVTVTKAEIEDRQRATTAAIDAEIAKRAELERAQEQAYAEEKRRNASNEAAAARVAAQRLKDDRAEASSVNQRIDNERRWRSELDDNQAALRRIRAEMEARPRTSITKDEQEVYRARIAQHGAAAQSAGRKFAAGSDERVTGDVVGRGSRREIVDIDNGVRKLGKSAADTRGFLARLFDIRSGGPEQYKDKLDKLDNAFRKNRASSVQFVASLRSIIILGVLAFLDQLIGAAIAVVGALVAIASAAAQAAVSLGGMAVAGLAQAAPVLGLLAAAWGRVGAVFDALKKQQQAQTTAADDATKAAERQKDAADAIRTAQEQLAAANRGVADANRGLTKAQEALNEARRKAKDDLQALTDAEHQAELQRRSAELAAKDSAKALRQAIATGDVSNQDSAQLTDDTNRFNVGVTARAAVSARAENARVGGDPEKLQSVEQAREGIADAERALQDARRGVTDAQRGLEKARQSATDATKEVSSSATALQQLLAQLSPAERRLYETLLRVKTRFRDVFTGPGGVTESITNAFTYGVTRAEALLNDQRLIGAARSLSDQVSTELRRIFTALSGSGARDFFADMAGEAEKNLPKVTTLVMNIGRVLANIARAAAPALSTFLDFLGELTGKAADATSGDSGIAKLEAFFNKGEQYAESFIKLGIAVAQLVLAVMGAGASEEGGTAVDRMTEKLNDATDWINANQDKVQKFFRDAVTASADVMWAIGEIAKALFSLFHADQVKTFSEMIGNVLVPVLANVFSVIGWITSALDSAFGSGAGASIGKFILSAVLLNKLFGSMITGAARFAFFLFRMTGAARLLSAAIFLLNVAGGPWLMLAVGIGVAVAMLERKFHFIKPTIDAVGKAFSWAGKQLAKAWDQIKSGEGVIGVLGTPLRHLGRVFRVTFDNIKDVVATAIRIIKRLFKGDLKGAIGEIGGLIGRVFSRIGRMLLETGKDVGKQALKVGGWILKGLMAGMKAYFIDFPVWVARQLYNYIIKPVLEFFGIKSPSKRFAEIGKNLIRGVFSGVRSMLTEMGEFFVRVGKAIVNGIVEGIKSLPGVVGDAISGAVKLPGKGINFLKNLVGGGNDKDKKKQAAPTNVNDTLKNLSTVTLDDKGMGAHLKAWQDFWKQMYRASSGGTANIQKDFRDMRVATSKSADRMYRDIRGSLGDINKSFEVRGDKMAESWANAISGVQKVTATGYQYIGHETNKILKSLGAKHINFGLAGPTPVKAKGEKRAIGGWVGQAGERGADAVHTVLGRGEAVLNWGHQKVVEPALAFAKRYGGAAYGSLGEVFSKVKGEHAGAAPGGMASGGFAGDLKGAGPGFGPMMKYLNSKFGPVYVMSGSRPGSIVAGSGRLSNHSGGNAVDITAPGIEGANQGNPPGGAVGARMDRLWRFISKYIQPKIGLDSLWRTMTGGNHYNHIHQGVQPKWSKNVARMKKFLSTLPEGGDFGGETNIKKLVVGGRRGAMKSIVQSALDKVTKAAQRKVDKEGDDGMGGDHPQVGHPGKGALDAETVRKLAARALNMLGIKGNRGVWLKMLVRQAWRESGFNPNARNDSAAGQAAGGPMGLMQVVRGTFAANKAKGHGNPFNPLDSLLAAIKYIVGRYGRGNSDTAADVMWARGGGAYRKGGFVKALARMAGGAFAKGGIVPGSLGQAVPILAHAKEWVLNEGQQHKIAGWLGTTKDKVQGALGFGHNQKTSAATGTRVNKKSTSDETFDLPTIYSTTTSSLRKLANDAADVMRKLELKSKDFLDKFKKNFDILAGEDGVLDQLSDAVELRSTKLDRALETATYHVNRKTGVITRRLSEVGGADRELENLSKTYSDLMGEKGVISKSLGNITARIERLRKGGISKGERESYNYLVGYKRALDKRLGEVQDSINENVQDRYEAVTNSISARTTRADDRAGRRTARLDLRDRFRALTGGSATGLVGAVGGRQRADVLNDQASELEKARKFALKKGRKGEAAEIQAQIDELRAAATEAVAAGLQADVDEITRQSGRRSAAADIKGRIGSVLGRLDLVAQSNSEKMDENGRLISELQAKQAEAARQGFYSMAETIGDQIADLRVSSTELAAQMLSAAVDQVNAAASRRMAYLDLHNRGSDLIEKAGDYNTAFARRGAALGSRGEALQTQMGGISALMAQAAAQGNQGMYEQLSDQFADLSMQLDENTAAIASNTVAARQARIDAITNRGSFQGGVFSGLSGIIDSLGSITGTVDIPAKIALAQRTAITLRETLNGGNGLPGLSNALSDITGGRLNVAGMDPKQIVAALSGVNFDQMSAGFNPEQKAQFESLINAVIENASATAQNTDQLKNLTGTTTQTWSSAAWQWFRQAVYNGNGGLLPQYQNPSYTGTGPGTPYSMQTASAAESGRMGSQTTTVNNTVNNEEKTVDMDSETVANKLYFRFTTGARG